MERAGQEKGRGREGEQKEWNEDGKNWREGGREGEGKEGRGRGGVKYSEENVFKKSWFTYSNSK